METARTQLPGAVNTLTATGDKHGPGHTARQSETFPGVLLGIVEQINSINTNDESLSCSSCAFPLTGFIWWLLVTA